MHIDVADGLVHSSCHGLKVYAPNTVTNVALFSENPKFLFSSWVFQQHTVLPSAVPAFFREAKSKSKELVQGTSEEYIFRIQGHLLPLTFPTPLSFGKTFSNPTSVMK